VTRGLLERHFQQQVIHLAHLCGWRVAHFRPAQNARGDWRTAVAADGRGFPDLVLARDRIIFAELKTATGRLSPHQKAWRLALTTSGAEYHLWRPEDFDAIQEALK